MAFPVMEEQVQQLVAQVQLLTKNQNVFMVDRCPAFCLYGVTVSRVLFHALSVPRVLFL